MSKKHQEDYTGCFNEKVLGNDVTIGQWAVARLFYENQTQ